MRKFLEENERGLKRMTSQARGEKRGMKKNGGQEQRRRGGHKKEENAKVGIKGGTSTKKGKKLKDWGI